MQMPTIPSGAALSTTTERERSGSQPKRRRSRGSEGRRPVRPFQVAARSRSRISTGNSNRNSSHSSTGNRNSSTGNSNRSSGSEWRAPFKKVIVTRRCVFGCPSRTSAVRAGRA
ncbi:uncharacterized protein [Drosophila takahashii]|uniref:uncharacterized protein isoform X2 n=1 Tax=Drosophila takahashii TaxID=29030 RepID=UPI003898FFF0